MHSNPDTRWVEHTGLTIAEAAEQTGLTPARQDPGNLRLFELDTLTDAEPRSHVNRPTYRTPTRSPI